MQHNVFYYRLMTNTLEDSKRVDERFHDVNRETQNVINK